MKTVGIIGNGKFSTLLQSLLRTHVPQVYVKVFSRNSISDTTLFFSLSEVASCDIVIPAVPIREFKNCIKDMIPFIKKDAIVIDVCSVKVYPVAVMKQLFHSSVTIIATHPLFGPGTVENLDDVSKLKIVMSFIQGSNKAYEQIKSFLSDKELHIMEMSPEDHDRLMAKSQFPSHVIANVLKRYQFKETEIDTKSAKMLHQFEHMIQADDRLLKDMMQFNSHCKAELNKLHDSYKSIMKLLQL